MYMIKYGLSSFPTVQLQSSGNLMYARELTPFTIKTVSYIPWVVFLSMCDGELQWSASHNLEFAGKMVSMKTSQLRAACGDVCRICFVCITKCRRCILEVISTVPWVCIMSCIIVKKVNCAVGTPWFISLCSQRWIWIATPTACSHSPQWGAGTWSCKL